MSKAENIIPTLEETVEKEEYDRASRFLAQISRNIDSYDFSELEYRRIENCAEELSERVIEDAKVMLEKEKNLYGNKAFCLQVEDTVTDLEISEEFLDQEAIEDLRKLKESAYEKAADYNLEEAVETFERGLKNPSNASCFTGSWDLLKNAEDYAELIDRDYSRRIEQIKEEVSENAPEFIYRHMLRNLNARVFESEDFGVESSQLDTSRLMLAESYVEDLEEMLEYRGDDNLESIEGFQISEVSDEAGQVFWNLVSLVEERPFETEEALKYLKKFGEKTGFYNSGTEDALERAEKIQNLHNAVNMAEEEIEQIFRKLDIKEKYEPGDDIGLPEALMLPSELTLNNSLEWAEDLILEAEEEISEENRSEKEDEYRDRIIEIRDKLSSLERLI
ncbi:MAG: hypothetical protein ABEJ56_05120 [Candidatus Nanohaloarchaea archaeon]